MRNFQIWELVDKLTYETFKENSIDLFAPNALIMLDNLRDFFGVPITINTWHEGGKFQYRGYRPVTCTVGAKGSMHRLGMAFDMDIRNHTAEEARQKILDHQDDFLLLEIKRMEADVSWLHVDCGAVPKGKERIYVFHP